MSERTSTSNKSTLSLYLYPYIIYFLLKKMPTLLSLIAGILIIWPIICWSSAYLTGWRRWEILFDRVPRSTNDTLVSSVWFRRWGGYNRCIWMGTEDYGVSFRPIWLLLFHRSFCIPWSNILSYQVEISRSRQLCILHTNEGDIRVSGYFARILASECGKHFVASSSGISL